MKARLPVEATLTARQRKHMEETYAQRSVYGAIRMAKLFIVVMHEEFGFGKDRANRFLNRLTTLLIESKNDPIYWEHVDRIVIDELKLDFDREIVDTDGHAVNLITHSKK